MNKIAKIIIGVIIIILFVYPRGYFVLNNKQTLPETSLRKTYRGVATYLINLDRSKERLKYVLPKVEKLPFPFQRVAAIDGQTLSDQEVREKVDFPTYLNLLGHLPKRGTIGCYLSHIKAWQTFINSNSEFALILEDDIDFDPDSLSHAVNQLILNKEYWDINNFETRHRGTPLVIKKIGNSDLVLYLTEVTHAGAYLISRKAAYKLLEKSLPIKTALDCYYIRAWEFDLKFTGIEPRLVFQKFGSSEINSTSQTEVTTSFIYKLTKPIYEFQSALIRFFYNLDLFFQLKSLETDKVATN